MAIAFMGGLFFVTFYLQNVHGMSPIDSGLHLLPLTGMMIVASPLAGAMITKVGPRIPLAGGMACTAVAMYGMSTLEAGTGSAIMSVWFALLGLGLAPVMVGATEVIVGNAPMELSGVAGGLQRGRDADRRQPRHRRARCRDGVEGRQRPRRGNWADAKLPPLTEAQLDQASEAVQVGVPPVPPNTPAAIAGKITDVAHDTFISGMSLACLTSPRVSRSSPSSSRCSPSAVRTRGGRGCRAHLTADGRPSGPPGPRRRTHVFKPWTGR